jgi:hypothetical protein
MRVTTRYQLQRQSEKKSEFEDIYFQPAKKIDNIFYNSIETGRLE